MAEMVTYLPISSPFIRFAGRYVDEAFGFASGWNFFIFEAALVPFEIVACNVILKYWTSAIPTVLIIGLLFFTFIVMVGGNPQGDKFGFRYTTLPVALNGRGGGSGGGMKHFQTLTLTHRLIDIGKTQALSPQSSTLEISAASLVSWPRSSRLRSPSPGPTTSPWRLEKPRILAWLCLGLSRLSFTG
jgi:hypothetical protein